MEMTRSYMKSELKRARRDLALLQKPGGADYARTWGMTRQEGLTQVKQLIRFFSQALGPWPHFGEEDALASQGTDATCLVPVSWSGIPPQTSVSTSELSDDPGACYRFPPPIGGGGDSEDDEDANYESSNDDDHYVCW